MKTMMTMFVALFVFAAAAAAQPLSIGSLYPETGVTHAAVGPLTLVNLGAPATADGSIGSVTLTWRTFDNVPCPASFKIRFFRRSNVGNTFTATATRGPFNSTEGQLTVAMTPPVPVLKGDVIGVLQLGGTLCGGAVNPDAGRSLQTAHIRTDKETFDLATANILEHTGTNVRGSANGLVYEGTIPAAGSAKGANGASFKTSVHLVNPNSTTPTLGQLVFHPAGRAASASDPKMAFTIPPRATVFYADVVAAMGQSGLGSIDLYTSSSFSPVVTVRVFDDQGAKGTSGFTEEFVKLRDAIFFRSGTLSITGGPNFRTNIGLRAVGGPSTVLTALYNRDGQFLGTATRTLAADMFEQVPLAALYPNQNPEGGYLRVSLISGSPFIAYASTTDNRTNDSSVQFAKQVGD